MATVRQFSVLPQRNSVGFNPDMQTFVNEMPLVIGDMNSVATDINNNALQILGQSNSQVIADAVTAYMASNNPLNSIYIDTTSGGGDGSSSSPFDSPWSALDALVDGVSNRVYCKAGQTFELGTGNEALPYIKTFKSNTNVSFLKWGTGADPHIKINHLEQGVVSKSPFILQPAANTAAKLRVSFYDVHVETVTNPNNAATDWDTGAFLYASINSGLSISANSAKFTIGDKCPLVTPYTYGDGFIEFAMRGGVLAGEGELIRDQYYRAKALWLSGVTYEAGATSKLLSHMRSDMSEILTNQPSASFLAEVIV